MNSGDCHVCRQRKRVEDWFDAFSRLDKAIVGRGKTVVMLASFSAGVALVQPKLKWELTDYATLANGILTVDVPPGAKPGLYGATAYVGFEPFEGRSLGAKVMAGGEVVFNMNTFEITSGESLYPRENGNYRVGQVQGCTQKSAWRDFGD